MKVTIVETLVYTVDVQDADEKEAVEVAKEAFESGDISRNEMDMDSVEYQINDDDGDDCHIVVDMTLDKAGNNIELIH